MRRRAGVALIVSKFAKIPMFEFYAEGCKDAKNHFASFQSKSTTKATPLMSDN